MGLLDIHANMLKQAAEKEAETKLAEERVRVIEKYAAEAKRLMVDNYPSNHTDEDVAQLTELMLNHDVAVEENQEKIAELDEAGRIMARAFVDETEKNQGK